MGGELVIFWLVFCGVVAYLASSRGRNAALWFLAAVILSPIIAGIILVVLPNEAEKRDRDRQKRFQRIRDEKREREEKEERRRLEDERRAERQQSQQIHAALLSKLAAPQAAAPPPLPHAVPPPLPGEPPRDGWHVAVDGQNVGPLEVGGLAWLASKGKVNMESLVWREGYPGWTTLKSEKQLVEAIRNAARKLT